MTIRLSIAVKLSRAALTTLLIYLAHVAPAISANQPDPAELVALLQSNAPDAEKAIACKQLAVFGDRSSVAVLAPLLEDPRLSSWARIALEAIPGAEADAALRQAMETVNGRLLVGVINSIGVRRDSDAVDQLAPRLNDQDSAVASAAAAALGRIGNEQARKALRDALASGTSIASSAIAEGCVLSAERLLADGEAEEAAAIYDEVRSANVARERMLDATRGAILARGPDGIDLLIEQLKSDDEDRFHIALSAARELPGRELAGSLAAETPSLTPQRAALVIYALADRAEHVGLPVFTRFAQQGALPIRLAAIDVLRQQGDRSCMPTLLTIALAGEADLSQAAMDALAELPDESADADIQAKLATAEAEELQVLIELVGRRRIQAQPDLLKAASHSDSKIRLAALTALGETIDLDHLAVLIARVAEAPNEDEAAVAKRALLAASIRMPDREACAEQLAAVLSQSSTDVGVAILESLGSMGGSRALQALGDAADGDDEQLQDVASRLLGEWMSVDAAPQLLAIAKSPDNPFRIRALRGYIRLVRQFDMPPSQRAEMCRTALKIAGRDQEKLLVFQVLERYPSTEALEVANQAANDGNLGDEAKRVARSIENQLKER
jgi:HEAT repeat protein